MDCGLCRKIIETYTEPGETVLDPMAGIDTTGVEAAYMGRNSIAVELEEKFVKITEQNIGLLERAQTLTPKGKAVVIKADSRELSRILGEKADKVIFSPPYRERYAYKNPEERQKDDPTASKRNRIHKPYSQDPDNIGNLKYGKPVDAVVTSPPFFSTVQERGYQGQGKHNIAVDPAKHGHKGIITLYAQSRENIDNIEKYGQVDAIVTSPPFKTSERGAGIARRWRTGEVKPEDIACKGYRPISRNRALAGMSRTSDDPDNITNMPYGEVDTVIFSPPYSESMSKRRKGYTTHPELSKTRHMGEGSSDENIGNLRHGEISQVDGGRVEFADKIYIPISCIPYQCQVQEYRAENAESLVGLKEEKPPDAVNAIYEVQIELSTLKNEIAKCLKDCEDELNLGFRGQEILTGKVVIQDGVDWGGNTSTKRLNKEITIPAKNAGEQETRLRYAFIISYLGKKAGQQHLKILLHSASHAIIKSINLAMGNLFIVARFAGRNISLVQLDKESAQIQNVGQPIILRNTIGGRQGKGNKPSYLSEMFKVYRECFKTLKPGGKMVLVLKDFIRAKKVVRLDLDTKKLVEGCGFRWVETKLFRLPSKSFWRVLYERRYPDVDTSLLRFEFVEVFEKPLEAYA